MKHTFATSLYRGSKNLLSVQQALGHSSITTTEIYTHISLEDMKESVNSIAY